MRSDTLFGGLGLCCVVALLGLLAQPQAAFSQEADADDGDAAEVEEGVEIDEEDESGQVPETHEADERGSRGASDQDRNSGRQEIRRLKKLRELVRKELELTEEQFEEINDLFEEQLEKVMEIAKEEERHSRENAGRLRDLQERINEARHDGDRDTLRELVEEFRSLRGGSGRIWEEARRFHDAVLEVLDKEQGSDFRRLIRMASPGPEGRTARLDTMRVLRRALRDVDLTPEQKEATTRLFIDLRDAVREARGDEAAMERMLNELREDILAELDEDQARRLEEAEERIREQVEAIESRRGERGSRERRPGTRPDRRVDVDSDEDEVEEPTDQEDADAAEELDEEDEEYDPDDS